MKEYQTLSTIRPWVEVVWAILTDGESYREWNPEIIRIAGRILPNARITAHVRLGEGRRTFTVARLGDVTEFRMHLRMSGPLSGPILRSVGDRQPEIDRFAAALKQRVEAAPASTTR